jgi:UDP-GlcNAc3NAcA epimerase
MRWISIVGARPQFVKIAPVSRAIAAHNRAGGRSIEDVIVHTGQHYDPNMSDVFFEELQIPRAAVDLGVGSGSHGAQTARMLEGIEALLLEQKPDLVIVYGDTNSTLAGVVAATKLHIPCAHVEAGLRSFNRRMPEELNRVATDHLSDLLLAPTPTAIENLTREGLAAKSHWTGDVMYDAVLFNREIAASRSDVLGRLDLTPGSYGVVTIHRAESTTPAELRGLLAALGEIGTRQLPLVFPVHPRTRKVIETQLGDVQIGPGLRLIEPLGYLDMLQLVAECRIVLTDSGGLQKEAFFLGRPCVTLRSETEWVETVQAGGNVVAGLDGQAIVAAASGWLQASSRTPPDFRHEIARAYGAGNASGIIVRMLAEYVESQN